MLSGKPVGKKKSSKLLVIFNYFEQVTVAFLLTLGRFEMLFAITLLTLGKS